MKLSLCIATRSDIAHLRPLLTRLHALRAPPQWQLVVAFNGTHPPKESDLAQAGEGLPILGVHEPRPGKGRALNRALTVVTGDLVVFTDDDVEPEKDWLENMVRAADSNPWANVFGGRILPRGNVPGWIRSSSNLQQLMLSEHDLGAETHAYPPGRYPLGPNMAVRRRAIDVSRARWSETIGPGTTLPVGDECAFLGPISPPPANDRVYIGNALVHHLVDGRYFPASVALRRSFQVGLAAGKFTAKFGKATGPSVPSLIVERLLKTRSVRELACVTARAAGVAIGTYLAKPI